MTGLPAAGGDPQHGRVGLVFVSHSAKIAEGLVDLAAQMAPTTRLIAAGGTDEGGIGTSFDRVVQAIEAADSGQGVVVLADLGSAVLTVETAIDLLDPAEAARVRLADGPLVEGGVAAAVAAETGANLDGVLATAQAGPSGRSAGVAAAPAPEGGQSASVLVTVVNPAGLHARPAAALVRIASAEPARVQLNGVDARSLLSVLALGAKQGDEVTVSADGADAARSVEAVASLIRSGFGEA